MAAVHIMVLMNKRDDISYEQFHHYWSTEHPKIWLNVPIVQKNIVKYSQYHADEQVTSALKTEHGLPMASYDGVVEMWGRSVEELMTVFQDEAYLGQVVPDEEKFLKRSEAVLMVGRDDTKWADGKKIEGSY